MPRVKRVEVVRIGDGEFKVQLPDDYTGTVMLNCSTGTVVNFQPNETRRPVNEGSVELTE